jgi:uncharacterized protein
MSNDPFPEHTDAAKLFANNGAVNAGLSFQRLPRLLANLADAGQGVGGEAQVQLSFGHDDEGRRRLRGSLHANVTQLCQRCLQPLQQVLHCDLDLLVLDSEAELNELPDADALYTDVIVDEAGDLDVLALIEDELLLSLPLVPMHDDADCSPMLNELRQLASVAEEGQSNAGKRPNPFAVLATLKQDKNQQHSQD